MHRVIITIEVIGLLYKRAFCLRQIRRAEAPLDIAWRRFRAGRLRIRGGEWIVAKDGKELVDNISELVYILPKQSCRHVFALQNHRQPGKNDHAKKSVDTYHCKYRPSVRLMVDQLVLLVPSRVFRCYVLVMLSCL